MRIDLAVEEVRVARMEQPSPTIAHGHPAVTSRVPEQGHERNVIPELSEHANAIEAEPTPPLQLVPTPARAVGHLRDAIPGALGERPPLRRGLELRCEHMDARVRKITQAADVIHIEVSGNDGTHVLPSETPALDLGQGRPLGT